MATRFPFPLQIRSLRNLASSPEVGTLALLLVMGAGLLFSHFWPEYASAMFLLPNRAADPLRWWTGHFVQPDSLFSVIPASVALALFGYETETRWGTRRFLVVYVLALPVLSLAWTGIQIGAQSIGFLSACEIPLSTYPSVSALIALRLLSDPTQRLAATGYRARAFPWAIAYFVCVVIELVCQGTWAIMTSAHLLGILFALVGSWVIQRRQVQLFAKARDAASLSWESLEDQGADEMDPDDSARLDNLLGRVAVGGLDGLAWRDWQFLQRVSRRLRERPPRSKSAGNS